MPKRSAGIVMYRHQAGALQVLLVHPGGPFWAKKEEGAWSIPKGEYDDPEDPLLAAKREFAEELGIAPPDAECRPLGDIKQSGGKIVTAFALAGDCDTAAINPGRFEMEWPPRSGRMQTFPEIDRAGWFSLADARVKILASQLPLIDRLETLLQG